MKQLFITMNTLRTNIVAFTTILVFLIGAIGLNSCTKSIQNDIEVKPTAKSQARLSLNGLAHNGCANLNMMATTTFSSSGTITEELTFTGIPGTHHYVVEAMDIDGTVLYNQTTAATDPQSFTRPLSFQEITWRVGVYSDVRVEDFSCTTVSRVKGGGIAIIIAERVTGTNPNFSPFCPNLQTLEGFYNQNINKQFPIPLGSTSTPLTYYTYPVGQTAPNTVSSLQFVADMQAQYGQGAVMPIHVFNTDPLLNTCSFAPASLNGASKFSLKLSNAASLTLGGKPQTATQLNTGLHNAILSAYPNYFNEAKMKKYTIAFVELN